MYVLKIKSDLKNPCNINELKWWRPAMLWLFMWPVIWLIYDWIRDTVTAQHWNLQFLMMVLDLLKVSCSHLPLPAVGAGILNLQFLCLKNNCRSGVLSFPMSIKYSPVCEIFSQVLCLFYKEQCCGSVRLLYSSMHSLSLVLSKSTLFNILKPVLFSKSS